MVFLNYTNIHNYARKLMEEFDVRAANDYVSHQPIWGNQQAIIAREVDRDPDLLIVSQPHIGLMVRVYIHKRLIGERMGRKAVLKPSALNWWDSIYLIESLLFMTVPQQKRQPKPT